MKYALTLLFILALGFFAAQSLELKTVDGYDIKASHSSYSFFHK